MAPTSPWPAGARPGPRTARRQPCPTPARRARGCARSLSAPGTHIAAPPAAPPLRSAALRSPPLAAPLGWDGAAPGEGGSVATGAGRAQAALSAPPVSTSCPRPLLPRPRGGERSAGATRTGRRSRGRSVSAARRPRPALGGTGRLSRLPCAGEKNRGPRVRAPPPAAPRAGQSLPRGARGRWQVWEEGR